MINPVIGLLVIAGGALVAQNLLMANMVRSASSIVVVLATNSAVGLSALLTLLLVRDGFAGIAEAVGAFRPFHVLPGLLGSFFVFASIHGYQRLGPTATIATLVASQLIIGLAVDLARAPSFNLQQVAAPLLGAVLLVLGAGLVAAR
ncbi:transporter family-2 protein [Aureimonas jatrophae]|uniref:Transporter family-2 protein n=1 Tax=Aureimonas jatrophae TaxID=1166073 RepID=A0A1H0FRR6_9HYPH|nr:transporter family-2 protein [Aureimonas jatrophae]